MKILLRTQLYLAFALLVSLQFMFVHCHQYDSQSKAITTTTSDENENKSNEKQATDSLVNEKEDKQTEKQKHADDVVDKVTSNNDSFETAQLVNLTKSNNEQSQHEENELDEDKVPSTDNYERIFRKFRHISEKRQSLTEQSTYFKLADQNILELDNVLPLLKEATKLGYDFAKLNLAKLYFYGDLANLDVNKAYELFNELALKGNADAHLYLGLMYSIGLGPLKSNQARALLHYTLAAAANSTFAQMVLGYRYWSGISVATSCEFALSYYEKVAAKVEAGVTFSGSASIQRIRLLEELENPGSYNGILDDDLIQYYQFLADKGDVQAQVGLGQLHFQGGRGVELNPYRAFHYFQLAAESGNTNAMAYLGKMYLEGNKVAEKDYSKAFNYFKMAADKQNPVGQSGLGIMYLYGKGVEKDYAMAFKYFSQAAIQGWVDGQLYLGLMHRRGYSVTKDPKAAIKYFTQASQSGHILGLFNLAEMHALGIGTLRSCPTAVELYKSVSERGPWGTMLMEAHNNYKDGKRAHAFIKYAVLSELGYEVAQSNAAFLLDRNEVSELFRKSEVYNRAFMYWSRSASQGSSTARVKLGDYHYYGLGTQIDYEMAANQYRIASEVQNNAQALFNLGYMYESGLGLPRDVYLAKRYYDLAAVTSVEAQVPVALALVKLFFICACEYIRNFDLREIRNWSPSNLLGSDWDLYVATVLAVILGTIFYLRRQGAG